MRGKLIVLITVLCAFLIGGGSMYYVLELQDSDKGKEVVNNNEVYSTGVVKCSNEINIDETGISTAVGEIFDATVTIQNYRYNRLSSSGSGFIYKKDSEYGYILTNHHVINNAEKVIITLSNDTQVEGKVLGSDVYLDLAVVRIDAKYVTQVATIGNSEESNVGDTVITVGTPIGYEYRGTITRGSLSGKNRMVEVSMSNNEKFIMRVLQIDAAINPGNSGGPLVNIKGEVIGINSLKLVEEEIEGIGFAIPIEYAMKYVDKLENGEKLERPFIGISMLNVSDTYRLYLKGIVLDSSVESGVVITYISKDSSAEKAGLQVGDIVTSINGNKVSNEAYLKYELFKFQVGDTISITYIRDGKEETTKVTLTKMAD